MWFFDVDTLAFREVNEAAVQKYGWSHEEFLRMTIRDIRPEEDLGRLMNLGGCHPELREALADAIEGARRVQQIAADLKGFSRPDAEVEPIDLSSVVAGTLTLAASELRHRARTVVDVARAPSPLGRAGRLRQVLLNLIVNAAHAIPEGDPQRHVVSVTARADGDRVAIEVSDTGPGVPEELRALIFEPFFTTKPVGKGTGLGLWVCRRAVEELGGEIGVRDRPGGGAVFRVSLPAAPELR